MAQKIVVKKLVCRQCGHRWIPRKTVVWKCPKCQSPGWNQPPAVFNSWRTDQSDA